MLESIGQQFENSAASLVIVDDAALVEQVGSRKALNTLLLASALAQGRIPLDLDDLRRAIASCVKERFVAMNLAAIDIAASV